MKKNKKIKKPSIFKLKKQAWKLWSEIVRNKGYCELCGIKYKELNKRGRPTILNAHHVVGRENHNLSWDIENGVSLCSWCHKFSSTGAHKGGIIFSEWFRQKYPERYEYLLKNYQNNVDLTTEYLENIIKNLEILLK
jgi:hypothetical protein